MNTARESRRSRSRPGWSARWGLRGPPAGGEEGEEAKRLHNPRRPGVPMSGEAVVSVTWHYPGPVPLEGAGGGGGGLGLPESGFPSQYRLLTMAFSEDI